MRVKYIYRGEPTGKRGAPKKYEGRLIRNPRYEPFFKNGKEVARKLYFSTDLEMDAEKIVRYYRSRFQIEEALAQMLSECKPTCGFQQKELLNSTLSNLL